MSAQNKSSITRRDSGVDTPHSCPSDEKMIRNLGWTLEGKWDSIATEMVGHFKETGHPVFKGIGALSRGILKRNGCRSTIDFNADSWNTELLFRTIHSSNQLSIYGTVSSWCGEFGQESNEKESTVENFAAKENEQLLKNVKPQEVNSLAQTSRSNDPVSGNRLRECQDVKHWRKEANLREFVKMRHSREESLWDELQNYS